MIALHIAPLNDYYFQVSKNMSVILRAAIAVLEGTSSNEDVIALYKNWDEYLDAETKRYEELIPVFDPTLPLVDERIINDMMQTPCFKNGFIDFRDSTIKTGGHHGLIKIDSSRMKRLVKLKDKYVKYRLRMGLNSKRGLH